MDEEMKQIRREWAYKHELFPEVQEVVKLFWVDILSQVKRDGLK